MKPHIKKNSDLNATIRRNRQWRVERATQAEQDDADWSDYDDDDEEFPHTRDEKLRHALDTIDYQGLQIKNLEGDNRKMKQALYFCAGSIACLVAIGIVVLVMVTK